MTRYSNTMRDILSQIREGYSPKEIKMAIGIASDKRYKGGNMTGAVNAIEKIKKGLSDHPQVRAVLQRVNEAPEDMEPASPDEGSMALDQLKFMSYAANKMMEHIQGGGEFPEWMQNKLSGTHEKMKSLYANISHDEMKEEVELEEAMATWKVTVVKPVNKLKKGDSVSVKANNIPQALKKSAKAFGDSNLVAVPSTHFDVQKEEVELEEAMSKDMALKILSMSKNQDFKIASGDRVPMIYLSNADRDELKKEFGRLGRDVPGPTKGATVMQIVNLAHSGKDKGDFDTEGGKHMISWKKSGKKIGTPRKVGDAAKLAGLRLEGVELEEGKSSTGYELYHKDFSSAMAHAYDFAKKKFGIEVDPKEIDDKVASGPRKPSKGKTNSYRLLGKDGKKAIQVQVYGMDNGKYELNMYKEETMKEAALMIAEKLKVSDGLGAWITDFQKSDAPQFAGKSDEQKKKMAIAAFVDAGGKLDEETIDENMKRVAKELEDYARKNGGIDKMDFMKAAMMMKKGQSKQLMKFVDELDTEPREKILSLIDKDSERRKEYKAYQKSKRNEEIDPIIAEGMVDDLAKEFEKRVKKQGHSSRTQDRERMAVLGMAKKKGASPADMKKLDAAIVSIINKLNEEEEPQKPDTAKAVDQMRDDKKKTRIAQLQLQIAKAQETINKLNAQEKPNG